MPAVQTSYRPSLARGVPGQIIDQTGYEVTTRISDTTAIPYGRAVSEGVGGKATLGGGAFLGVSVRDVTLDGMPIDPLVDAHAAVDVYDKPRNVAIMTRGRMLMQATDNIAAGDAVYYDYKTGEIGNSSSGQAATGFIDFTVQPVEDETVTINGKAITFKDSGATGLQVNIGATLGSTIDRLVTLLNTTNDTDIDDATYESWPPGTGAGTRLVVAHDTPGVGGNSFSLATTVTGSTVSDDTLAGGYAGDHATGSIAFTVNPADGKKITLNGVDVVFKNSPGASDIQIGGDLATTLASLKTDLNNGAAAPGNNAEIAKCTYDVVDSALTISFDTIGTGGNAYTISTDVAGAAASGATLTGGAPASVALTNAKWSSSALAGDLAVLSLGVQR